MIKRLLLTLALGALVMCGKHQSGPTPIPSPVASPTPTPPPTPRLSLLSVSGHEFVDDTGGTVYLVGAIGAGAGGDPFNGWPHVSRRTVDEIAGAGLNFTLIRVGPFTSSLPENGPFAWDNPSALQAARDAVAYANSRGLYVQVEIFDHWCAQPVHGCSPFDIDEYQGKLPITQEEYAAAPANKKAQADWVRSVVSAIGGNAGVLWVDSNEAFKRPSREWSASMRLLVQDEEAKRGYQRHPFGTNSHNAGIEYDVDFITRHGNSAVEAPYNKPTMVTEHDEDQSAETTIQQARVARDLETSYHRWRGDLDDSAWFHVLSELGKIRRGE
jgi:hypothetical protein